MFNFRSRYFLVAVLLFVIELLIALFVKDAIIRPHIGDLLVVIMIYCFLRAFLNITVVNAVVVTLLFAYVVEALQYFNIVYRIGWQQSAVARIVIGTHFSWIDILAYTAGAAIVLIFENRFRKQNV